MQTATIDPTAVYRKVSAKNRLQAMRAGGSTAVALNQWQPNPGPQYDAYNSEADVLGYGGAAGGGKTDLALGLAATKHKRSVIFRRVFPNLREVIERSRDIFNPTGDPRAADSYNESLHRWKLSDGRMVEFEACQHEKDKFKQRGRPRDLYVFDEAPEFSQTQVEFIIGWLRSTDPNQITQVVLTFNPPTDGEGEWVINYFLPWLAYLYPAKFQHPNPAKPGELRWYTTINGEQIECEDGEPFEHDGETIIPKSRTFIPAKLEDNPYYGDDYRAQLQAMPEPLRSQLLYGNFAADSKADPMQVIPTSWVKAAQRRWLEREKPNMPLSGVGVDLVRGGRDCFALSKRYGTWFDKVEKTPGADVEDGPAAALLIHNALKDEADIGYVNLDVLNVGSSGYDSFKAIPRYTAVAVPVNVGMGSDYVVRSNVGNREPLFAMYNLRAEMYWRMREALDPEHGDDIALPPGNELVADLCAARYKLMAGQPPKILIEPKDAIKKRLGRSPDEGEAVMLANLRMARLAAAGEIVSDIDMSIYKPERRSARNR